MSCSGNASASACPCGPPVFPVPIANPPGLDAIAYRVGDYTSFRQALLLPRAGETQLSQSINGQVVPIWRPDVQDDSEVRDLAAQMIEWWAYLADVLTFYNERVANQAYLRTADRPASINRLVGLLGYRPRPGLGALGTLGALASGPNSFTLPSGFQIQSKPGPALPPQVFELESATTIVPPLAPADANAAQGITSVEPPPDAVPAPTNSTTSLLLQGATSAVKTGDRVLVLSGPPGSATGFAVATVTEVTPGKDRLGNAVTTIAIDNVTVNFPSNPGPLQLWRSRSFSQLWQYPPGVGVNSVLSTSASQTVAAHLASIVRGLQAGDPIVFEGTGAPTFAFATLGTFVSSTEMVWYANPTGGNPAQEPASTTTTVTSSTTGAPPTTTTTTSTVTVAAIPIPHTVLTFGGPLSVPSATALNGTPVPDFLVRFGWALVGNLAADPAPTVGGTNGGASSSTTPLSLSTSADNASLPPPGAAVLVQDANGNGAAGAVVFDPIAKTPTVQVSAPVPVLVPPLQVLVNLLQVTRGKTVANEVLGNGNALVAGQDFTLQNAPVTYLQDPGSISGDNYSSTVQVWVNQLQWAEVRSFYGQPASAQVFVTYEDEQGNTHVLFGDGNNGARLPTGINNVTATYRYGSGAAAPAAGTLTVVLQPQPGLRSLRNPVAVGGGADPDAPADIRQLAPRSVLTLNRAVSVDDCEAIAAAAPNVTRARAVLAFDPQSQRPRVTVWVGNGSAAVAAAQAALAAAADPNRLPQVLPAMSVAMSLSLTFVHDNRRQAAVVQQALQSALVDPDLGLLGGDVVGIGQVFFDSQFYQACLRVPGVVAVHALSFVSLARTAISGPRYDPGAGRFFLLDVANLTLTPEAAP